MTTAAHRICPQHRVLVLDAPASIPAEWALVPTEEELLAQGRSRDAFKADQRWLCGLAIPQPRVKGGAV